MTALQFTLLGLVAAIGLIALGALLVIAFISVPPATSRSGMSLHLHWRNATSR